MAISPQPTTSVEAVALDVIDRLAGITPGSPLAHLRAGRPEAARYAQGSYDTLLEPADPGDVSHYERATIALRIAVVTPSAPAAAWYRARLRGLGAGDAALAAIEQFPDGPALSPRETALLRHTDRLTLAPHAASRAHIAELKTAGLSARDIVTIAQLIAFVTFQVRVAAGLRGLVEEA